VARLGSLVLLVCAACGDDEGIGISLLRVQDLVESEGRDEAEIAVFVSRDCFYSVTVEGVLLASGRWESGERRVTLGPGVLGRCDNEVRVHVAAPDGSAGGLEVAVWRCRAEGCVGECSSDVPDAGPDEEDSGPVDPYPGPLCDPCTETAECGDLPNLCVTIDGSAQGLCGTECFGPEDCPEGFDCLAFRDDFGNLVTEVCLPWPPQPVCPYLAPRPWRRRRGPDPRGTVGLRGRRAHRIEAAVTCCDGRSRRGSGWLAIATLLGAACGAEDGVGLRVLSTEVRDGVTPKVAIEVQVTASCFFSVVLNGELEASGRWGSGVHEVLIPGYLLHPRSNVVRLDVAGEDGSSARADVDLALCETGAIACGDFPPDAGPAEDASAPDLDGGSLHRSLCAPCEGDAACGGLPNECVFLYPDEPGVCGTYCGDDYVCPDGFVCTQFQDATHTSLLCFPPGPSFICP
jgi:hypothetical protein